MKDLFKTIDKVLSNNLVKSIIIIIVSLIIYKLLSNVLLNKTKKIKAVDSNKGQTYVKLANSVLKYTFIVITFIIGGLFSFLTIDNMDAFKSLKKPLEVPGFIFPIVWSILYILMSISLYLVLETSDNNKLRGLKIYGIQLVVNSLWTLIFFGLKSYLFAFIWLVILLALIIYMLVIFFKIKRSSMYLNIPYLLWVIFAGYLNFGIYLLNR